jgi:hypothetical protein
LRNVAQYSSDKSTVIIIPVTAAFQNLGLNLWCNLKKFNITNVVFWALSHSTKEDFERLNIPVYYNIKFSTTE